MAENAPTAKDRANRTAFSETRDLVRDVVAEAKSKAFIALAHSLQRRPAQAGLSPV